MKTNGERWRRVIGALLSETIETLQELKRMHQLNIELLEQLAVACSFLSKNHVEIPNGETFVSLLEKAMTLLDEIQADEPKIMQYTMSNRRKVTAFKTDEDVPEPFLAVYKGTSATDS